MGFAVPGAPKAQRLNREGCFFFFFFFFFLEKPGVEPATPGLQGE